MAVGDLWDRIKQANQDLAPYGPGAILGGQMEQVLDLPNQAGALIGLVANDPPPPAPPSLVKDTGAPADVPSPQQMAPPIMQPQMPAGANIGGLNAQARKIGQIGQQGMEAAKDAAGAIDRSTRERKDAADKMAEAEAQKAQARAGGIDSQLQEALAHQERLTKIRKAEDEAVKAAERNYDEYREDALYAGVSREKRKELQAILNNKDATPAQQASAKAQLEKASQIDPDKYLGSFGKRVTAGIAMALGAYGAALTGGSNDAMKIIQQAIQDNIDAQKANRAAREREAERAEGGIGRARAQFADARQQEAADYAVGLEMAKLKIDKIITGLEGTEAHAKGMDLKAQLDANAEEKKIAILERERGNFLSSAVAQGGLMTNAAQLQEQRAGRIMAAQASGEARSVPGLVGTGISKEAMNEAAQMLGDGEAMLQQISELRNFVQGGNGVGSEIFPSDAAKRAAAMAENLRLDYGKNLLKLGVLSADDLAALGRIIPEDPTAIRQGAVAEKLRNAETFVRTKMEKYLRARGYQLPQQPARQKRERAQ